MSYKTTKNGDMYDVVEGGTDQIVYSVASIDVARKMTRSLNLGSGFNGNTPPFFNLVYDELKKAVTETQ